MSSGIHTSATTSVSSASSRTMFEMLTMLLLGVATVATAWCGIQSSRWNGEESDAGRRGNLDRIEASRLFGLASAKVSYDANLTAQYAAAIVDNNVRLQTFMRDSLMRPEYLPFLDDWQTKVEAGDESSGNLFTQVDYIDAQFADSRVFTASSDAALARAAEASANADDYLISTLLTATALFFAGSTNSFASRSAKLMLVAAALVVLTVTAARLVDLPVI